MELLSAGDVSEISGLTHKELSMWCEPGLVVPIEGGGSQGSHRKFSILQVVGFTVANELRKQDHSCPIKYAADVVTAFESLSEEKLLKEFNRGNTHLVMIHLGKPLLREKKFDWIDVQKTYRDVMKKIAEIEHRLRNQVGGRIRGLAGTSKH